MKSTTQATIIASALLAAALSMSAVTAQESSRTLPPLYSPPPKAPITKLEAHYTALPYKGGTSDSAIMLQAAAGSTIPLWNGSATVGTKTFHYKMVGKDPAVGNSPNIPTVIIPVKITIGSDVFDPTVTDTPCAGGKPLTLMQDSPIFNNITIKTNATTKKLGNGQYVSLFQRGNYFTINPTYRVNLSPTTIAKQSVTINGGQVVGSGCSKLGEIDLNTWDNYVQGTLMPALASKGVTPSTFPIFLFHNVVMTQGGCCILGYHSAMNNQSFGGAFQTYSTSDYDTSQEFGSAVSDISVLTHEVAEWLDDPNIRNPTPPWGHIGQVNGCQSNLEVGDPLSGTLEPIAFSGMTYHVQDLAFTSWFYRQKPPTSYNRKFSLFGTFTTPAVACSNN